MLHRSFKPQKCKTSLKLAMARMKLLKNKREVQIRQMKRDLAQLLETGQEKTAMMRVEHVVREEKTMAAYDFIDIYCELIVARLPIIESQKNCPIDLKEAVSSIVFASHRCADVPEFLDVRKHFTAKYGKDFITSATELRPECGVNHTMVEKLSARTPDGQTKLKILTAIAEEHNVKWDATAFGEKELKPPEDLLNGPRINETSGSGRPAEPLVHHYPPNGQKVESSHMQNDGSGSSQISQTYDPTNIRTPKITKQTSMESRPSEEERQFERPYSQNANQFTSNRDNWSMGFKDATSAAQAAAESAERASRAARAAAELSSVGRVSRQHSKGSHEPAAQNQQRHTNERESRQGVSKGVLDSQDVRRKSSHSGSSGSSTDNIEDDLERTDIYCQKCSSEVEAVDNNRQTKKSEESDIQSSHFGVESVDHHHQQHIEKAGHTNSMKEGIRTQSSRSSSSSEDANGDIMFDSKLQHYNDDSDGGDHMFARAAKESRQSGSTQPSFDDHPPVVFDEAVSDSEITGDKFGLFNTLGRSSPPSYFSEDLDTWSPGRHKGGLAEEMSNAHSPFIRESYSPPELSERTIKTPLSQSGDFLPATYDDYESDGLNSESEEEVDPAKYSGRTESSKQLPEQNYSTISSESHRRKSSTISPESHRRKSSTISPESHHRKSTISLESTQRPISSFPKKETKEVSGIPLSHSSSDDSDSDSAYPKRNQETELNDGRKSWEKNQGMDYSSNIPPSAGQRRTSYSSVNDKDMSYRPAIEEKQRPLRPSKYSLTKDHEMGGDIVEPGSPYNVKDSDISSNLSSESKELDFGRLRGGFRSTGYVRPPYRKGLSVDNSPSYKQQQTDGSDDQSNTSSSVRSKTSSETPYQEASTQRRRPGVYQEEISSRNRRSSFESDSDDSEVIPLQTSGSRGKAGGRLSHRTKESLAISDASSLSTSTSGSRLKVISDRDESSQQNVNASEPTTTPKSRRSVRTVGQHPDPEPRSRYGVKPKLQEANISVEDQPSTPVNFHATETVPKPQIPSRYSGSPRYSGGKGLSFRSNVAVEQNPDPPLQSRLGEKPKSTQTVQPQSQKSMDSSQSSGTEQSSNTPKSGAVETLKQTTLGKETISKGNSLKKGSHVHPKLPDYDSFAAHFESLRSSR